MDLRLYVVFIMGGILGIVFHLAVFKLPAVKSRAKAANVPFSFIEYLKEDCLAIISSGLTVLIFAWILDEIVGYKPEIMNWVKFFSVFVGYTGSSILVNLLGQFDKTIKTVVNIKTNIADGKDNI